MDPISREPASALRILGRLLLVSAFAGMAGGTAYAINYVNKKFGQAPAQAYVPASNASRAGTVATDELRSKALKWNLYRAEAGFSVAAPASFTMTFPRPSGDLYLSDVRSDGRAIVRAATLGPQLGLKPFTTWKRGATVAEITELATKRFGKVENVHADLFIPGWYNYERRDEAGSMQCLASVELLGNIPVALEACSSYGLEFDTALMKVSVPTTLTNQQSTAFLDQADEEALAQAFAQQKPIEPAAPSKAQPKKRKEPPAAEPASGTAAEVAIKLSPQEQWDQYRDVSCFGRHLEEIASCYVEAAQEKTKSLLEGDERVHPSVPGASTDKPGVDIISGDDDEADDSEATGSESAASN